MSLYLRGVGWGIATGAAIGGATGAGSGVHLSGLDVAWILGGGLYGVVIGAIVAVIPAVIGSVFVSNLALRPTTSWSPHTVRRDLTVVFGWVVGLLDALVLTLILVTGAGPGLLPVFIVANVVGMLVLWAARTSIGRALEAEWERDAAGV